MNYPSSICKVQLVYFSHVPVGKRAPTLRTNRPQPPPSADLLVSIHTSKPWLDTLLKDRHIEWIQAWQLCVCLPGPLHIMNTKCSLKSSNIMVSSSIYELGGDFVKSRLTCVVWKTSKQWDILSTSFLTASIKLRPLNNSSKREQTSLKRQSEAEIKVAD